MNARNAQIVLVDVNREDQEDGLPALAAGYEHDITVLKLAIVLMDREPRSLEHEFRYTKDSIRALREAFELLHNDGFEHLQETREAALDALANIRDQWMADLAHWQLDIDKLQNKVRKLDEVAEELQQFQ